MKKLLSILLVITLILSLGLFTACGGNGPEDGDGDGDDGKITYTVTVKDASGAGISGVKLFITDDVSIFQNKTTDANGKATISLDAENSSLGVMITQIPNEYETPTADTLGFHATFGAQKDASITLSPKVVVDNSVAYTVKIIDQFGNAVEGAVVQICHNICVNCDPTNSEGITVKKLSPDVAEITLKVGFVNGGVPAGYTAPEPTIDGTYVATIAPGETEVTITIQKNV